MISRWISGVRIDDNDLEEFNNEINQLKKECFGTKDVEVKSVWIRIADKRKKHYLDPFKIKPERLDKFGEDYINLISSHSKKIKL